jgi:hypothetical protein
MNRPEEVLYQSEILVFEPAKAYSERRIKSISHLWKLKEVFELVALLDPEGEFHRATKPAPSFVLLIPLLSLL